MNHVVEHHTVDDAASVAVTGCGMPRNRLPIANPATLAASSTNHTLAASATRRGLTLLEVILALAILGLALTAISQLVSLGARAASESRDLTRAQLIAESLLAQLAAEVIPVETVEGMQVPYEPNWVYSILIEGTDQPGLISVHVIVEEAVPSNQRPLRFIVTRWMVDPELVAEGEETVLEPTGSDL